MLQSILFIIVFSWLGLAILLYVFQPYFIYFPQKKLDATPDQIGLEYRDILLQTKDGLAIHGWYLPHPEEKAKLLFLHGNAGNISHRLDSLKIFHDLGLSTLIIDYRGFGQSDGKPSEKGTYLDAMTAWNYLTEKLNQDNKPVFIFGRSLGGCVATWLATKVSPKALILESTFTSVIDMGKHYYPYLPIHMMARIRYNAPSRIDKIKSPILFLHSPEDDIVPYKLARVLFEKAKTDKTFIDLSGDHNYGFLESGDHYIKAVDDFIRRTQLQ